MRISITARHRDISEELRQRARALVERLTKLAHRAHDARVLFGDDHGASTVEVRLHTARGRVLVGHGEGDDHRTALDRAVSRVRRQLDKPPRRRAAAREGE